MKALIPFLAFCLPYTALLHTPGMGPGDHVTGSGDVWSGGVDTGRDYFTNPDGGHFWTQPQGAGWDWDSSCGCYVKQGSGGETEMYTYCILSDPNGNCLKWIYRVFGESNEPPFDWNEKDSGTLNRD